MRTRNPANPGSRLGMPFSAWPACDQTVWRQAFVPVSGFKFRAPPGTMLRQPSKDAIMNGYARWLDWLRARAPETLLELPAARVTETRVLAYVDDLFTEITPQTILGYACRLRRALELMCPRADWRWFGPIIGDLKGEARTARQIKRNFVPTHQLFRYGLELMREAERASDVADVARAEAYRNGLMFAFLALRPIRRKNITELELGTQLVETPDGYDVAIPRDLTKTKKTLEFPVPDALVGAIRRYLGFYRPILAAGSADTDAKLEGQPASLWLARSGAQYPADTFSDMITKKTHTHFGVRLTPHEFRHCAATSIAEFNPEDFHIIRVILGHGTLDTAQHYYLRTKGVEAARTYQTTVKQKRKELNDGLFGLPSGKPCRERPTVK